MKFSISLPTGFAELGRDPKEIKIAPQFSLTIAKTAEEAERRYMTDALIGRIASPKAPLPT
jgi:alkanesulfonate monooxygenase SsuD/methylene tetrahydromethanopterin reductase-like flavin-dependent oxidoreductase (luciferase family)